MRNHAIGFRWAVSALQALQEIIEDWLIEFFEDSFLLDAFTHRMTIMPRDFDFLSRLRYRYDQLLVPGLVSDHRMHDILTLPSLHPHALPIQPIEVVHDRGTRSQSRRREEGQSPTQSLSQPPSPFLFQSPSQSP